MLNQMKAMGAIAGLLKNKEKLKAVSDEVKHKLETTRVFGEAGGGAVRVTCTCRMVVERVEIAPALAASADADQIGAMVEQGVNDALRKAEERAKVIVAQAAEEMGLGDIVGDGALSEISGLLR